jgi:enoyl-CoA hydratase/carnithine racemase
MGLFLAMTGWEVRGFDAVRLGLATHYCESDETHRFGKLIGDSSLHFQFGEDTVEQAFGMFSDNYASAPSHFPLPLPELHRVLDDIFHVPTVEGVFVALQGYQAELGLMEQYLEDVRLAAAAASSPHARFGGAAAAKKRPGKPRTKHSFAVLQFVSDITQKLLAASPLSLKCTFKLMQLAQFLPLERCIQLEYRLAQRLLCATSNPADAELFRAARGENFKHTGFASVPDSMIEQIFEESWDEDQELVLNYDKPKKPTWYI